MPIAGPSARCLIGKNYLRYPPRAMLLDPGRPSEGSTAPAIFLRAVHYVSMHMLVVRVAALR